METKLSDFEQRLTSYLASLALSGARSSLLGSSERWAAVPVLEVLHHLAVPLPLLLRVVLRQLDSES